MVENDEYVSMIMGWNMLLTSILGRKWLLIFDNAGECLSSIFDIMISDTDSERESFMRGYWPIGAAGAIL